MHSAGAAMGTQAQPQAERDSYGGQCHLILGKQWKLDSIVPKRFHH